MSFARVSLNNTFGRKWMIGKTLAIAATLLLSTQVYAQTNAGSTNTAQGVTSGPAAGTPAGMKSPQAGTVATKHQRQVLRHHSRWIGNNSQPAAGQRSDETGATGSSSPSYAPSPR
jgi:hypothetical protein